MSIASEKSRQLTHLMLVSSALLLVACSSPGSKEAAEFEAIPCVFVRVYGDTFSDTRGYFSDGARSLGDIMIRGWYCAPPNSRLDKKVIRAFIAGIGIKGLWVPDRPVRQQAFKFETTAPPATAGQDGEHLDKANRVVFTTGISNRSEPVDDIREISLGYDGPIYIYVEWAISLRHHPNFFNEWRVFDGGGSQKIAISKLFEPRNDNWRTWLPVHFAKNYDQPGQWKFEIYFDNEKLVEEYLTVLP